MITKQCPFCEKKFTIEKTPGHPKKFCTRKCQLNYNSRLYRKRNPKPIKPLHIKNCTVCGKTFKCRRISTKCCSDLCSHKNYRRNNPDKYKGYSKKHYNNNREKFLKEQTEYRKRPDAKIKRKKLREKYKQDGTAKKHRQKSYENLKNNPTKYALFKIINNCRSRVRQSVKTFDVKKSNERKIELIGCTSLFLKKHLEKQFKPEMTWENYGTYWEVDHIIPISRFDITVRSERNKANHYTNLQPLEADINRKLGDKKEII